MALLSVRRFLFGAAVSALAATPLFNLHAQASGRVTGKVIDKETGAPVDNAQIRIDGSTTGSLSAENGTYTISRLAPGSYQLRVIRIGYLSTVQSVRVTAGQAATADFSLAKAPYQLEQIVTTATGEQNTRELGNSIAKIETAKLVQEQPITNMQDVLNGRTAGVVMIASNGTVGGGARVRVRGISSASLSNDPLVIVDGIRVENGSPDISGNLGDLYIGGGHPNFLNNLNPDEIESMEIVKGPSAATLYGTQSANGVIVITTKKGRSGAPKWSFFGAQGASVNPFDYEGQYYNKGVTTAGAPIDCITWKEKAGQCTVQQRYSRNLLMDPGTTPFGRGIRSNYGGQLAGGNDNIRYFISGAWEDETGVMKMPSSEIDSLKIIRGTNVIPRWQRDPNELTKEAIRGNFGLPLGGAGDLSLSSGFITSNTLLPQTGDNIQGVIGSGLFGSANPARSNAWGFAPPRQGFSKAVTRAAKQFTNSAVASWKPLGWLTTRGTVGIDYLLFNDAGQVRAGEGCTICGDEWKGLRAINKYTNGNYTANGVATANTSLTSTINSKTSAGVQWSRFSRGVVFNSSKILPPGGGTIDAGAEKTSGEQTTEFVTLGTYIEQQFGWKDRLYLTGAVRRDQNAAFGANFGAVIYPKGTVSWVVKENGDGLWVNNLRLRTAYGKSGQQPDVNSATTYLNPVTASILGQNLPAVTFGALGNSALKPEQSREIESGFDLATLHNRITLNVTYYDKLTSDAIVKRNLAPSQAAGQAIFDNVGVVSNKGLEVSLNSRVFDFKQLHWDAQVEASWNKNNLVSLATGIKPFGGFGYQNAPGHPLFSNYWPTIKSFSDKNGDGAIDPSEVTGTDAAVFGGSSVPTRNISLNNTIGLFRDKLRLTGLLDYRGGNTMHEISTGFACALGPGNCRALHDPTASLADQAAAVAGGAYLGAYWQKGDFVRLREVSASFEIPKIVSRKLRAGSANIVGSGRNLWIWKKEFTGADPESQTQGTDATPYNFVQQAQPRTFLVRVNLSY